MDTVGKYMGGTRNTGVKRTNDPTNLYRVIDILDGGSIKRFFSCAFLGCTTSGRKIPSRGSDNLIKGKEAVIDF
jgi:hypothetical protein